MIIGGVVLPPVTIAIGTIIGALLVGLGMGIGTELGKYYVNKYLLKRLKYVANHGKKIIKIIYSNGKK